MLPTTKTYRVRVLRASGGDGGAYTPDVPDWTEHATEIPALIQWLSGSVVAAAAGRELDVEAKMLVNPGDMPAGVFIFQGDAIEIVEGPVLSGSGRFIVQAANPIGDDGGYFDDEYLLRGTQETFDG